MDLPVWLATVVVVIGVVLYEWRRSRAPVARRAQQPASARSGVSTEPDHPVPFGPKSIWIAVPSTDPDAVVEALGLRDTRPCSWASGVAAARGGQEGGVFVTPPVEDWVLATGTGLPDPGDPGAIEGWRRIMRRLSRRFGDAWFFATHRVSGYSAWGWYESDRPLRLFAHAEDPLHDEGTPLIEETEMGDPPGEMDVLSLAGSRTVDPSRLEAPDRPPSVGRLGWYRGE